MGNKRFAVVTGGASGIGLEISAHFLRNGYGVAILDRDPKALEKAQTQFGAEGTAASPWRQMLRIECNFRALFGR
ncbi:hypothetical protein ECAE60S_03211 [Eoetvoesiella caeni]